MPIRLRRRPACPPPWWPENEPWPPHGRRPQGRVMRGWAFRRFAWIAVAFLVCAVVGAITIASMALRTPVIVVAAAIGVVIAAAALSGMMRGVIRPLDTVMEAADRVAAGDYDVRVAPMGPPPVRALARAFNTMTERLQSQDRIRRDLMADVAHELRTPLAVIRGTLEGLIDGVYPADERHLQQLVEETHVLSRLIEDLRTLALSDSGALKLQIESIDLGALAEDVVAAFTAEAAARGVRLEVDAAGNLPPVDADPVRIREVLGNLISNALRYTSPDGSVRVRLAPAGRAISVEVQDTGRGMTKHELARAFDRFYKGPESRGSGLGLAIAKSLVTAHGGAIHASSQPGQGTSITFTLPQAA